MTDELMERLAHTLESTLLRVGALKHTEASDWTFGPCWVAVQAILSELSAAGFVVVPEVPTEEMVEAGMRATDRWVYPEEMAAAFSAMLKARPV